LARVPQFKTIPISTPTTIVSYNQIAFIIASGSYVTVTNAVGEVATLTSSSTLGSDRGGGTAWDTVTIQAFVTSVQIVVNGDISF
jgi:hypothetical protein